MRLNLNDWIDGWFLSLSDNPDKLDKRIRIYESARMIAFLAVIGSLVLQMLVLSKTGGDSGFLWYVVLFELILLNQSDIYIKVLKLMRQQQERNTNNAT